MLHMLTSMSSYAFMPVTRLRILLWGMMETRGSRPATPRRTLGPSVASSPMATASRLGSRSPKTSVSTGRGSERCPSFATIPMRCVVLFVVVSSYVEGSRLSAVKRPIKKFRLVHIEGANGFSQRRRGSSNATVEPHEYDGSNSVRPELDVLLTHEIPGFPRTPVETTSH